MNPYLTTLSTVFSTSSVGRAARNDRLLGDFDLLVTETETLATTK